MEPTMNAAQFTMMAPTRKMARNWANLLQAGQANEFRNHDGKVRSGIPAYLDVGSSKVKNNAPLNASNFSAI
jgi:hypothetical protein